MELKEMPIGARVTIRPSSEYYGINADRNPADEVGVVEQNGGGHGYIVRWLHSDRTNGYRRGDLKYWRGKAARPKVEKIGEDKLEALIPKAIRKCRAEYQSVVARYAFIYNNKSIQVNTNTACHAQILGLSLGEKKKIAAITTCINRGLAKDCEEEVAIAYYDWLLNRSPYADAFLTKDAEDAYKNSRYVTMDVSAPANMIQAALIATRQTWEHPHVCYTQHKLVKLGVHENVAHLLGCFVRSGQSRKSSLVYAPRDGGHFHLDVFSMTLEKCQDFVANAPYNLSRPFNEGGDTRGVHRMFKGECLNVACKYIKKIIDEAGSVVEKTTTNPFAAAKKEEDNTVSAKKLAKYVIEKGVFL